VGDEAQQPVKLYSPMHDMMRNLAEFK